MIIPGFPLKCLIRRCLHCFTQQKIFPFLSLSPPNSVSRHNTIHERGRCCLTNTTFSQCEAWNQCFTARQADTNARTSITACVDARAVAVEQRLEP